MFLSDDNRVRVRVGVRFRVRVRVRVRDAVTRWEGPVFREYEMLDSIRS